MGVQHVTITDVARRAGVSKSLVSLALNDRPGVAPTTRRRILAAAEQLEWVPSAPARSLSLHSSLTLGLVLRRQPRVLAADPFFPSFIAGIESVLAEIGWTLTLSVVPDAAAERRAYLQLGARRVDGFFLTDLLVEDERAELLRANGLRGVTIGRPLATCSLPAIDHDDRPGIIAAVQHLLGGGHRRIAYVTGAQHMVHGVRRLTAFTQAMADSGLTPTMVQPGDFSPGSAAIATRGILGAEVRPTAIIYGSDPMAMAGLGVLQASGLRVPDDISVVGFDGNELGGYLHPTLTTVITDPYGWGAAATHCLLSLVRDGAAADVELPAARFEPRASTAPLVRSGARPLPP